VVCIEFGHILPHTVLGILTVKNSLGGLTRKITLNTRNAY